MKIFYLSALLAAPLCLWGNLTIHGGIFSIRPGGAAFFCRTENDIDARWRVQATGTQQAGYGDGPPVLSWGLTRGNENSAASLIEVSATEAIGDQSVGLSLNDRGSGRGAYGIVSRGDRLRLVHLNSQRELVSFDRRGGIYLRSPSGRRSVRLWVDETGELRTEAEE